MAEGRGLQQGRQRFAALGVNLLAEGGVRLVATVAVLGAGFGATGVTAAPLVGTACAAGLALWSARDLPPAVEGAVAPPVARAGLSLVLFAGFATVTNLDVVVANRVLDDVAAGEYGAAALFGRVVLLAPLAVGVVLVPKVIDADESGRPTLGCSGWRSARWARPPDSSRSRDSWRQRRSARSRSGAASPAPTRSSDSTASRCSGSRWCS